VLLVDIEASPLAVPWMAEVDRAPSGRGPARHGLQWVNGAPRAARQALLAVVLGGKTATEVRLIFQGQGPPLHVHEVFLYGPGEGEQPLSGRDAAAQAYRAARSGRWSEAVTLYERALRAEPERASHHAAFLRARWRAAQRQWLDVESLPDGGLELVSAR
jgi:hypothetical protein